MRVYSDIPSIYMNLERLKMFAFYNDTESESKFLNCLRFLRIVINHNDTVFCNMLVNKIKSEVYMDVFFSLIERSKVLSKEVLIETLWFFTGFFNVDRNLIDPLVNKEFLKHLDDLIDTDDLLILEQV